MPQCRIRRPPAHRRPRATGVQSRNGVFRRRDPEIVIDNIDVEPAQRPCPIGQAILATFTFQVVFHLIRSGLTDVHTGPPSQMFRGDFIIHRRPPCGSSWPAPASTAPAPGGVGLAHPMGVVRRGERRELFVEKLSLGFCSQLRHHDPPPRAHCAHTRRGSHADTTQLDQHAERQARNGNHLGVRSLGTCHPDRHRQRSAVGAPYDIIGLVI